MSDDDWEVLELIGRGSFGEIRKVRHKHTGQVYCRKEILYKRMNVRELAQLEAEVNILERLKHKNIVRYHSRTQHVQAKMVYMYMEYCGNGDLHELIAQRRDLVPRGKFSETMIWQIMAQLLLALYRCHNGVDPPPLEDVTNVKTQGAAQHPAARVQESILHRDIKPQNVFLDEHNRVKLGDFGLSKVLGIAENFAQTYVGTPFYMSPEIINGKAYTAKSDIWSLGCVIYEMCALEPPFNAHNQVDLNLKIKAGRTPSVKNKGYSEALDSVIKACLTISTNSRPSADALLQCLQIVQARSSLEVVEQQEALQLRVNAFEVALHQKQMEIASKMDELDRREQRVIAAERELHQQSLTASNERSIQESMQGKLADAQERADRLEQDRLRLEQTVFRLQDQISRGFGTHCNHTYSEKEQLDGPLSMTEHDSLCDTNHVRNAALSLVATKPRMTLTRARTDLTLPHDHSDPLHLRPKRDSITRTFRKAPTARSPRRRDGQNPLTRTRSDAPLREPLAEGFTRILQPSSSRPDLQRAATGAENIRPPSSTSHVNHITEKTMEPPLTPTRDISMKHLSLQSSPQRQTGLGSPTRNPAKNLFTNENDIDVFRTNQRQATLPSTTRSTGVLQGLHKATLKNVQIPLNIDEDAPSPFLKDRVYRHFNLQSHRE